MPVFKAYRGSGSILLVWWSPQAIPGCLGYAIQRRVDGGAPVALDGYVGFADGHPVTVNAAGQPSTQCPYQRFTWTDFEPPAAGVVEYRVVAIAGLPGAGTISDDQSPWLKPTDPKPTVRQPFFNFGIVGSRWFAKKADDYPTEFDALRQALAPHAAAGAADAALEAVLALPLNKNGSQTPTIGDELGGPLASQVHKLLDDAIADTSIHIYAALFELSDSRLIAKLGELGERCHLILANGTHEHGKDENSDAATTLGNTAVKMTRRMIAKESVYAHNKFAVLVRNDAAQAVLTGSTNWTPHGLYTQVNNGLVINDAGVADAYWQEWKRLSGAVDASPPPQMEGVKEEYHFTGKDNVKTSVFFSPHPEPKGEGANSPDLAYAASLIANAKQGILTLMLDPGWQGSLLQDIREKADKDASLYIRGVVNSDPTVHAQAGDSTAVGFLHGSEAVPSNYDIVLPSAQRADGTPILDYLGRVGIVVVHSKVIVIDPLGDHPVVMTGSHNDGVKAATINDDNLVIIEGDKDLAIAYAVNAISVFNHFWWRHNMAPPSARKKETQAKATTLAGPGSASQGPLWTGLIPNDSWQEKFYVDGGSSAEARFWGLTT